LKFVHIPITAIKNDIKIIRTYGNKESYCSVSDCLIGILISVWIYLRILLSYQAVFYCNMA